MGESGNEHAGMGVAGAGRVRRLDHGRRRAQLRAAGADIVVPSLEEVTAGQVAALVSGR